VLLRSSLLWEVLTWTLVSIPKPLPLWCLKWPQPLRFLTQTPVQSSCKAGLTSPGSYRPQGSGFAPLPWDVALMPSWGFLRIFFSASCFPHQRQRFNCTTPVTRVKNPRDLPTVPSDPSSHLKKIFASSVHRSSANWTSSYTYRAG
jgi:hypothetical protein